MHADSFLNYVASPFHSFVTLPPEPAAGFSSEANGLAERHDLTLLDMAMPMLADSDDASFGLPPLSTPHAADAIIHENDLHNATPSASAIVGATPHEGL